MAKKYPVTVIRAVEIQVVAPCQLEGVERSPGLLMEHQKIRGRTTTSWCSNTKIIIGRSSTDLLCSTASWLSSRCIYVCSNETGRSPPKFLHGLASGKKKSRPKPDEWPPDNALGGDVVFLRRADSVAYCRRAQVYTAILLVQICIAHILSYWLIGQLFQSFSPRLGSKWNMGRKICLGSMISVVTGKVGW